MSIKIKCVACGKFMAAPDSAVGKKAKCPSCGQILAVPAPAANPTPTDRPTKPATPAATPTAADSRWKSPRPSPNTVGPAAADPAEILPDTVVVHALPEEDDAGLMDLLTPPTGQKPRSAGNPFAAQPSPDAANDPLARGQKKKNRGRPFVQPLGQRGWSHFLLAHKLAVATVAGNFFVALTQVIALVKFGPSPAFLGGMVAVFIGILISAVGFLPHTGPPRKKSVSTRRAQRVGTWFIAGIIGIIITFIGIQIGAMYELSIPMLAALASPFLLVFAMMTLITGVILLYYLIVVLFPRVTGFQIAACTYLAFFVLFPFALLGLTLTFSLEFPMIPHPPDSSQQTPAGETLRPGGGFSPPSIRVRDPLASPRDSSDPS
jgi:phage FluMu protein Com